MFIQRNISGTEIFFLRQVDDFAISCENEQTAKAFIAEINSKLSIEIKYLGLVKRFNGVDINQTSEHIKIHCSTYINKILSEHNWLDATLPCHIFPIPMKAENNYSRSLELAQAPDTAKAKYQLEKEMKFNYRQAIGELIYAMVTCRPDISFPLIKLSQYSSNPAKEHYFAVRDIFRYLSCTKSNGIHYWRQINNVNLPLSHETFDTETDDVEATLQDLHYTPKAVSDADWGGDVQHRRSVTGFVIKLAGGAVHYKTRYQPTIALSSTEAEFSAACDAGKAILYVRSLLEALGLQRHDTTTLHVDNNGALNMANQRQPTKYTRHIDIKQYAIQDWVEKDLLILRRITSNANYADASTKVLGRTLHHHHMDYIMGRVKPTYTDQHAFAQQH